MNVQVSSCVNYCCNICWFFLPKATSPLDRPPSDWNLSTSPKSWTLLSSKYSKSTERLSAMGLNIEILFLRNYLRAQIQPTSWLSSLTCKVLRPKGWTWGCYSHPWLEERWTGKEKKEDVFSILTPPHTLASEVRPSSVSYFPIITQVFLAQLPWCPTPAHTTQQPYS